MFKVNQRVRIIKSSRGLEGKEGVIVEIPGRFAGDCAVKVDGVDCDAFYSPDGAFEAPFDWLRPLSDPQVEKIKEMAEA